MDSKASCCFGCGGVVFLELRDREGRGIDGVVYENITKMECGEVCYRNKCLARYEERDVRDDYLLIELAGRCEVKDAYYLRPKP
jgi:hypothetical protein